MYPLRVSKPSGDAHLEIKRTPRWDLNARWSIPYGTLLYVDPVGVGSCIPCGFPSLRGLPTLRSSELGAIFREVALERKVVNPLRNINPAEYHNLRLLLPWVIRYPKLPFHVW